MAVTKTEVETGVAEVATTVMITAMTVAKIKAMGSGDNQDGRNEDK
jgi:hypothetical protein